ncbi:MAG: Crp/Fnr family transcriptional regulator [Eubacteriales bacterium]|nr:Crp/Fnr family transcriptional regulator [Eubacteriales bacterium]
MKKHIINAENFDSCRKLSRHLNDLKMETKAEVKDRMVVCKFDDCETINIEEFFSVPKIWTLLKGELHFIMRDMEGKTIVFLKITVDNSGFIFPKGCLDSLFYTIEARCVGETELCYIPEQLSIRMYNECPSVRKWQTQCSMKIVSKLLELINDLSFLSLKERLRKKLCEYCLLNQTDIIPLTHEQLADELASSREVISRLLKKLEEENIIKIKRKSIQMLAYNNDNVKDLVWMVS